MAETNELHARLMEDARNYDPTAHHRGLLAPYRDVLLVWRAKFMSYEQIAVTLHSHGIKVSPAGVGVYCRGHFTKAEIDRARREHHAVADRADRLGGQLQRALFGGQTLGIGLVARHGQHVHRVVAEAQRARHVRAQARDAG